MSSPSGVLLLLVWLGACAAPSDDVAAPNDPEGGPAADVPDGNDPWDPAAAEWDAAEVERRVVGALAVGIPTPCVPDTFMRALLWAIFDSDSEGADSLLVGESSLISLWAGEGELPDTTRYTGLWRYSNIVNPAGVDASEQLLHLFASMEVADPSGNLFQLGGAYTTSILRTNAGVSNISSHIGGLWDNAGGEGWVSENTSTGIDLVYAGSADEHSGTLVGGLDGAVTLYARDIAWESGVCGGLPTGELLVRDPTAWWHSIVLTDDCTGCGQMTWNGQDMGTVCVGEALRAAISVATADLLAL